jgi:hypothetical protein
MNENLWCNGLQLYRLSRLMEISSLRERERERERECVFVHNHCHSLHSCKLDKISQLEEINARMVKGLNVNCVCASRRGMMMRESKYIYGGCERKKNLLIAFIHSALRQYYSSSFTLADDDRCCYHYCSHYRLSPALTWVLSDVGMPLKSNSRYHRGA